MNFSSQPPDLTRATRTIITINVVIFLLGGLLAPNLRFWLDWVFGLNLPALLQGRLWTLVTHQFLHGNFMHLLVNMLALWFAGRELEIVLGTKRFVILYLLGGVVGGLAQVILDPSTPLLIGASGAVCAVLLALITLFPEAPITALIFFVLPLRMRAKYLGYVIVGASVLFWISGLEPNIGHLAHLGGFATGWLYALVFRRRNDLGGAGGWPSRSPLSRFATRPVVQEARFTVVEREPAVDLVLAKVLREGIESLTREERRILEESRRPRRWR